MESFRFLSSLPLNFEVIESEGNTALHIATKNGNTKMVYKSLLKGLDYNQKNNKNETACSIARESNFENIYLLFVSYLFTGYY